MSLLDTLVKVDIVISTAAQSEESFSNMLIVGPGPTAKEKTPPDVGIYTELTEVTGAGWGADDPVYKGASIAFANGATPVYIAVQKNDEAKEDITATLDRAAETPGWYGIAAAGLDESDYTKAVEWADANSKPFGFTTTKMTSPVGTSHPYAYGFVTKSLETYPNNAFTHIAMMAQGFRYDPGSETWAYKTLAGIEAEPFSTTDINKIKEANLNCFVPCAGKNITLTGVTTSGEWIDVIRFRDWLKNDMQTRIYNLLIMNPKVPFTSGGIALVQNQMLASLVQGQRQGGISPTEFDEDGNEIPGFTVTVPNIANISASDKSKRLLTGCKFTARLAGAVHLVEVSGTLVG